MVENIRVNQGRPSLQKVASAQAPFFVWITGDYLKSRPVLTPVNVDYPVIKQSKSEVCQTMNYYLLIDYYYDKLSKRVSKEDIYYHLCREFFPMQFVDQDSVNSLDSRIQDLLKDQRIKKGVFPILLLGNYNYVNNGDDYLSIRGVLQGSKISTTSLKDFFLKHRRFLFGSSTNPSGNINVPYPCNL